jgi:ribonuclease HI
LGRREEKFIRSLLDGATIDGAAEESGLSRKRAVSFLESVAGFAAAVGPGMKFGLPDGDVAGDTFPELVLHTDGASLGNPGPSGAGGVIETPEGVTVEEFHEHLGVATNNVAEYEAVRIGLKKAVGYGARRVHVRLDSQLVANQLRGTYKVKDRKMIDAYLRVEQIIRDLDDVTFESIPRELNKRADRLAQTGARRGTS